MPCLRTFHVSPQNLKKKKLIEFVGCSGLRPSRRDCVASVHNLTEYFLKDLDILVLILNFDRDNLMRLLFSASKRPSAANLFPFWLTGLCSPEFFWTPHCHLFCYRCFVCYLLQLTKFQYWYENQAWMSSSAVTLRPYLTNSQQLSSIFLLVCCQRKIGGGRWTGGISWSSEILCVSRKTRSWSDLLKANIDVRKTRNMKIL